MLLRISPAPSMSIAHLLVSGLRAPLAWLLSLVKIQGSLFRLKENVTIYFLDLVLGPVPFWNHVILARELRRAQCSTNSIEKLFSLKPFRKSVRVARRSILFMFSHIDALAHTRAICSNCCCFFGKVISRTSCLMTPWQNLLLTLHDTQFSGIKPHILSVRPHITYFYLLSQTHIKLLQDPLRGSPTNDEQLSTNPSYT